jgi:hypothetical protein
MKNSSVLILALNLLVGCTQDKQPFSDKIGNLESNNWKTECLLTTAGSADSTEHINSGIYSANLNLYSDQGCSTAASVITESGNYVFTDMDSGGTGTVDWTVTGYQITALSASQTSTYNGANYCGYSDWQVNVPKNVLGRTCDTVHVPVSGTVRYDIYNIAQLTLVLTGTTAGDLKFGYIDASHDGTSPSTRPDATDARLVYKIF